MRCDFCGATPVRWDYPCVSIDYGIGVGSKGDWAACDDCHKMIERDDRGGVLVRAIVGLWLGGMTVTEDLKDRIEEIHDPFFTFHGPAKEIQPCGS